MKRVYAAVILALLVALTLAPVAQGARSTTAFTGEWIGQDPGPEDEPPGDGSTVHLFVSGGARPNMLFIDDFGSVCVNNGASTPVFTAILSGFVDGTTLYGRFNVAKCGPLTLTFIQGEIGQWLLDDGGNNDPSDDTLWDGSVLWTRN